jgi:DNA repair photolyase
MDTQIPDTPRKGRGAVSNRAGRFEPHDSMPIDDGWGSALDVDIPPLRTTLTAEATKKIVTRNQSPDVPFDRSINPYKGCEHGCVYCFARPTHAYLGLSPGLDFESRIFYKPDAAALLEKELRTPKYKCAVMAMGTNTDPYQPVERELNITRRILEVLAAHDHPVGIVTKSSLVMRDLDILGPMGRKGLAQVCLSVTTLDRGFARKMEPRCPTPARRLEAIRALSDAGVQTGVMAAPMIPVLNDPELESILEAACGAGATIAGYVLLRLPRMAGSARADEGRPRTERRARHAGGPDVRAGIRPAHAWHRRIRPAAAAAVRKSLQTPRSQRTPVQAADRLVPATAATGRPSGTVRLNFQAARIQILPREPDGVLSCRLHGCTH